ncbi:Helix-turn-helix [Nocardioides scoriae]|uniref:Helix-turn-helix n=1 Tax=Nocardioides scoriae TaxID=642780 RepID=A0A1H1VFF5_9ACTN|nr:helix-turn-helix transcriptional regulator [Nocardioides scoriae]SDS83512.1 Helix-turn-helix [Nocardioides scoriae]
MPRRSSLYRVPNQWLSAGTWPRGTFTADAPDAVAHAVAIAMALAAALEGRNKSEVAAAAEIERSTLYDILAGKSWPDTVTLAKLEAHLGQTLWPATPAPPLRRATDKAPD